MRESIGKRVDNGEWVVGFPLNINGMKHPVIIAKEAIPFTHKMGFYGRLNAFPVLRKSIGQYIGRKSKSGKKIYEGQIVSHKNGTHEVTYDNDLYAYDLGLNNSVTDQEVCCDDDCIEIVGNVIDNIDLLS